MQTLPWYNRFSAVYQLSRDYPYGPHRRALIDSLLLTQGDSVVDVFCGAGANFPILERSLREGIIVGIDGSRAMLDKARMVADRLKSTRVRFELVEADFTSNEGVAAVVQKIELEKPSCLVFVLGLTCLPNWREFFAAIYDAAPRGSRFGIMDVYSSKPTLGSRFINWIGAADCARPVWQPLAELGSSFERKECRPFRLLDVSLILAWGNKA